MANDGINKLARVFQTRIQEVGDKPPILDFGTIQADMSIKTDRFPVPIPPTDYMVCRSVSMNKSAVFTSTSYDGNHPHGESGEHPHGESGKHPHGSSGEHEHILPDDEIADGGAHEHPDTEGAHSHPKTEGTHTHPKTEGSHSHKVRFPESMYPIKPSDRVLVAWVGNDACVIDIIYRATVAKELFEIPDNDIPLAGGDFNDYVRVFDAFRMYGIELQEHPNPTAPSYIYETSTSGQGYTAEYYYIYNLQTREVYFNKDVYLDKDGPNRKRIHEQCRYYELETMIIGEEADYVDSSKFKNIMGKLGLIPEAADLPTNLYIQTFVWDFFIGKGFSEIQVAGIMGNAQQESGWNPLIRRKGSSYWGLFQLGSDLSIDLQAKYSEAGLDISSYGYNVPTYQGIGAQENIPKKDLTKILEIQLEFVYNKKPTGSDWVANLKTAKTVYEAAEIFLTCFEGAENKSDNPREGDKILYYAPYVEADKYYQEADKRRDYAKTYYDIFKTEN